MLYAQSNRLVRLFHSCIKNVLIELDDSFYCSYLWTHYITKHYFLKFVLPTTTCIVRFCMSLVAVAPAQCLSLITFPRLNA